MSDDFIYQSTKEGHSFQDVINDKDILNKVLTAFDEELNQMGGSLWDRCDRPKPEPLSDEQKEARIIQDETN